MKVSKIILSFILSITLLTQASWAQMASTEALFKQPPTISAKDKIIQFSTREEVVKILGQMDVEPHMIEERVASMTDEEALQVANKIATLPAGADGLSTLVSAAVFVFVVLLITDILGFTKVFGFTRTIR